MKKSIVCLLILWCASYGFAQSKQVRPDLTGAWELNKAKSDLRDDRYALSLEEAGVTILNHDPELRLTRRFRSGNFGPAEAILYTDGRGETNAALMGQDAIKSTTKWEGKKLISRYVLRRTVAGSPETVDVIDEWKLSDDSRTLTLTTTLRYLLRAVDAEHKPPFLGRVPRLWVKRVYERAP
jgi:hypothetical protein